MGSPEKLYSPEELAALSKEDRDYLHKELKRHLRASPAIGKVLKAHSKSKAAHKSATTKLKAKLRPTLKQLKAKTPK